MNRIRYAALNTHGNDPDYVYGLHWLNIHRENGTAHDYTISAWGNKPRAIRRMRRFYRFYSAYCKRVFRL